MPKKVEERARKEVRRLQRMSEASKALAPGQALRNRTGAPALFACPFVFFGDGRCVILPP